MNPTRNCSSQLGLIVTKGIVSDTRVTRRQLLKASLIGAAGVAVSTAGFSPLGKLAAAAPAAGRWRRLNPRTAPSPRGFAAMAYDAARGVPVLFSGSQYGMPRQQEIDNETWTWNGVTWNRQSPSLSPPGRYAAGFVYHPPTRMAVLFGGQGAVSRGILGDTWLWNGKTWSAGPDAGPPARRDASMAFYPGTGSIILFGGMGVGGGYLGDTWEWNGRSWRLLSPSLTPLPAAGDGFAHSAAVGKLILFGGLFAYHSGLDGPNAWAWDGRNWSGVFLSPSPPIRAGAAMAADPTGRRILLFGGGGGGYLDDTWTLTRTWSQHSQVPAPSPRVGASLAPDPINNSFLLFGGDTGKMGKELLGDTWAWGPY